MIFICSHMESSKYTHSWIFIYKNNLRCIVAPLSAHSNTGVMMPFNLPRGAAFFCISLYMAVLLTHTLRTWKLVTIHHDSIVNDKIMRKYLFTQKHIEEKNILQMCSSIKSFRVVPWNSTWNWGDRDEKKMWIQLIDGRERYPPAPLWQMMMTEGRIK